MMMVVECDSGAGNVGVIMVVAIVMMVVVMMMVMIILMVIRSLKLRLLSYFSSTSFIQTNQLYRPHSANSSRSRCGN